MPGSFGWGRPTGSSCRHPLGSPGLLRASWITPKESGWCHPPLWVYFGRARWLQGEKQVFSHGWCCFPACLSSQCPVRLGWPYVNVLWVSRSSEHLFFSAVDQLSPWLLPSVVLWGKKGRTDNPGRKSKYVATFSVLCFSIIWCEEHVCESSRDFKSRAVPPWHWVSFWSVCLRFYLCPWALFQIFVLPKKCTLWPSSGQGWNPQQRAEFFPFCSRTEGIFPPHTGWSWVMLGSVEGVLMDPPHVLPSLTCITPLCSWLWSNIATDVPDCHFWAIQWVLDLYHSVRHIIFFNVCICNLPAWCLTSIKMWSFSAMGFSGN